MHPHRWHYLPIVLVSAGVLTIWVVAIVHRGALGWWQAALYVGGAVALAAALWFRRELTQVEVEAESLAARLAEGQKVLAVERSQLQDLRRTVEYALEQQSTRLDKREQALAQRLVAYHEWMEFPQPINLSTRHPQANVAEDEELADLARKDRLMMKLLKAETKVLYENILNNKYAPEGQLQLVIVRDEIYGLIQRVAHIYRPDIDYPLLEASMTRIVRAASRACLQLLVVVDELPINVKDHNLSSLYVYLRNAVKAWQMYKSTEPYWPYMNTAYYLGRFAMGANPLALGAWWFVGALGKRGATSIATHVVNRQALAFLGSLVSVIGFEVAGLYGGDFRHRDANWIYGAELTELLSVFPLSRDGLAHALREVGALELRSEYDRVFLYRCLAGHVSARPEQYRTTAFLTAEERHAIAARLEKFLETYIHGKTADRVERWKREAEERLGVRMTVLLQPTAATVRQQIDDAVRSLASFLLASKQLEPTDIARPLAMSQVLAQLSPDDQEELIAKLIDNPPFFFEHPDLDPDGDLATLYLKDLATLNARTTPRDALTEDTLCDVAAYLRREGSEMRGLVEKAYAKHLEERMSAEAPTRKVTPAAARAALDLLEPGDECRFLYGNIAFEWPPDSEHAQIETSSLWLLGAGPRLILFVAGAHPRVVWQGDSTVHVEHSRNLLASVCRITGGSWLVAGAVPNAIRITPGLMSSYPAYFRPLLTMVKAAAG